jgi:hypothetical protein
MHDRTNEPDRWIGPLLVAVPFAAWAIASSRRGDPFVDVLGVGASLAFPLAAVAANLASRRRPPRVLRPTVVAVLAAAAATSISFLIAWARTRDPGVDGQPAGVWASIVLVCTVPTGVAALLSALALRIALRATRRREDKPAGRLDQIGQLFLSSWLFMALCVTLAIPTACFGLGTLYCLVSEPPVFAGSVPSASAAAATVATFLSFTASAVLVSYQLLTRRDGLTIIVSGLLLWGAVFSLSGIPTQVWPLISCVWIVGLVARRRYREAPPSAVVSPAPA